MAGLAQKRAARMMFAITEIIEINFTPSFLLLTRFVQKVTLWIIVKECKNKKTNRSNQHSKKARVTFAKIKKLIIKKYNFKSKKQRSCLAITEEGIN